KLTEDFGEVHQAFADEDLFTKLHRVGGPLAIFCVNAMNVRPEDIHGVDGIRFAIEDKVCGVETDAQIRQVHILDGTRDGGWRLLPGFHEEALAVCGAVFGYVLNGENSFVVKRVAWIFRNEAAMGLYLRNAEELGEVGRLLESIDASGAAVTRHKSDGG